jgi:hypothetical protein
MRKRYFIKSCVFIGALILYACNAQQSSNYQKTIQVDVQLLASFYNYSTVDWAMLDTLYYRPYNCDWPEEIGKQILHNFPIEKSSLYWHRLQNAKTYLHQQTLPLRIGASDEFLTQLNHTEAALDSVFVRMVSQEYYLRLFVDCYEDIMPQEIDRCFEILAE